MPFTIVRQDISRMRVDAVVNAANERLSAGGGVCGAIFAAAGHDALSRACAAIGGCQTGHAVITPGFALPAKYVIHAVGPVWRGGAQGEAELLRSAYAESLKLAEQNGLESIAFPLISSGIYGYPKPQALDIAIGAIRAFLEQHDMDVYLAVFGDEAFQLSQERYGDIQSYIDACDVLREAEQMRARIAASKSVSNRPLSEPLFPTVGEPDESESRCLQTYSAPRGGFDDLADTGEFDVCPAPQKQIYATTAASLDRRVERLERTFSEAVLELIDQKGFTDVQVYKRANLDRKLFSKLRGDPNYKPSKRTAVALCVALELDETQACSLLARAGYALSPSERADVIVRYFLERRRYDMYEINEALFRYGQPCLGV